MTKIALVCPILILTLLRTGKGQPKIQFDAATVKVDQRGPGFVGMRGGPGTGSPGRVTWRREWLRELVATAFHVDSMNVSGPEWIAYMGAPVYAVTATMPPDTPKHDFELMLQSLLIEQFDLQVHHEPKLFPEYELVIAPGGSRLKASEKADADEVPLGPPRVGADGFPIMPPGHGQRVSLINGFHARFQNYSMAEFAEHLSDFITPPGERRRYVVDRTGIEGVYDFTLEFDQGRVRVVVGPRFQSAIAQPGEPEPGSGLPNIFRALEGQLGLKLVKSQDVLKDIIVIDHARKIPMGN